MIRRGSAFVLAALLACGRGATPSADAGVDGGARSFDPAALARAEDLRKAKDVPPEVRTSHEVMARRRSARALARIADAESVEGLIAHLADEDRETTAWAAYGLGYACKGREDAHVRLLAARAATVGFAVGFAAADAGASAARGAGELDPATAIARGIARCANPLAEQVLTGMLATAEKAHWPAARIDPVLLGLGDLATRRKQLSADAMTAILEVASDKAAPHDLAFYALARAEPNEAFARRITDVAKVALGRPGPARILAIRALGRAGKESPKETAADLGRIAGDAKGFSHGERAEAARALAGLGEPGQQAIAATIAELTPDAKDPIAIANLAGAEFHVLRALLAALAQANEAPKRVEPALNILANLVPPTQPKPGFARRLAEIRCNAALALARAAHDAEILRKCDAETSAPFQEARLAALLRRPLGKERLPIFRTLAKSDHLRVREAVVEALASHPEVGEAAAGILADALGSKHAGLVAAAAETLNAHPERAMVLAESEKRAALDPRAPPPTANPAQEIAAPVAKALAAAIAHPWPEDRFETRIALIEAAASVRLPQAKEIATAACTDPNAVVRERAQKALRTLGAPVTACEGAPREAKPAAELDTPAIARPPRIILTTDGGDLTIVLEPELSPITVARLVSLARSGFYKGIVVHRVVPGFVAQLGDPEGDGYGGSGTSLRCETSPVPFGPLDVGMALAGRDTGSSQFFVALSRTPHLDGEYTRIGRAEGDWASVAQGDVILDVRVVD